MIKRWVSIVTVLFLMMTLIPQYAWAGPIDTWTLRSPLPTGNTLSSVTFGNGTFVAVGSKGTILTSSDGANWTSRTSGTVNILNKVIWGSSLFVAVGAGGLILTSADGVSWTSRASGLTTNIAGITYGNGLYVAVGNNGRIVTSSNGVNWASRTSGINTSYILYDVAYGNGTYTAVGSSGVVVTSSNGGVNWTSQTSGYAYSLTDVAYGDGRFVALGGQNRTLFSNDDGVSWRTSGTNYSTAYGISFVNEHYVAVGDSGAILTGANGVSWTNQSSGTTIPLTSAAYGNGTYVAVGETTILTSPDRVNWTSRMNGTLSTLLGMAYLNGMFMGVGATGTIVASGDGANWTTRTSGTPNHLYGVAYAEDLYVAVGLNGTVVTSADGASWTKQTSGTSSQLTGIAYGNGNFVAIGTGGTILTSGNGLNWTGRMSATGNNLKGVAFGNGLYVAVGNGGTIETSIDGISWTSRTSGTSNPLNGVVYGNDMYVAVGNGGTIVTSLDGMSWAPRTSGTANQLSGVTYGNGMYAAVGVGGTLLTSGNGANWTSRASGSANDLAAVAYGDSTYVAAGANGTIVQSEKVPPAINSVSVNPDHATVPQGGSKQFTAAVDAISGVMTTVKWASSDAGGKVAVDGTGNVTVAADTAPGDYTITATSTVDSSKKGTATITVTAVPPEPKPTADVDYAAEQLTGLVANANYSVNGTAVTADDNGKVKVEASWLGTSLSVVKKGDGTTTMDSAAQTLALPARPAAPTAGKTDETTIGGNDGALTDVTSAMEYKRGASGSWQNVTGSSVTELSPDTYYVRVKATSSSFASTAQTVTIGAFVATPETKPTADVDYAAEQFTELESNGAYTINGTAVVADGNGKVKIEASWLGTPVSVVKKGNGTTTTDSAAQTISLPARPTIPTAGKTDETTIGGNNGTLTGVTPGMEYKRGASGSWQDVSSTSVTDLTPDTYYVRVKATSSSFASETQTVTIAAYNASAETKPAADVDYATEQLTGLELNGAYSINGTAVVADSNGKVKIEASWLGTPVSIVKKGNGTTTTDSAAQTISLPARPAAPTAGKTDESSIGGNDGTLTNVSPAMEYKRGASGSWQDVSGTSVTALAPDTYTVRFKATSTSFASTAQTVTIAAFVGTPEPEPDAKIDYAAEELTGLEPNGAYSVKGTAVTADGSGKVKIEASWLGTSISVVKKGNGTTTIDSAAQSISLPARPATPTAGKTDESSIGGNDGTLTDVTSGMEYKRGASGSWQDVTGTSVTGLVPDSYYLRVKATSSSFASATQTVTIAAYNASAETMPAAAVDYAAEQLTGLEPNGAYTINGSAVVADSEGKLKIDASWLGLSVSIVKTGNGTTTTDSPAQTLVLPARPAAPVDISVTDVTYNGAHDGSILHIQLEMEYKEGSNGAWTKVSGTSVVGLAPGIYYVRVAATATNFASIPAQVTVHDSDATIPGAPDISADDASNKIVGLDTTMGFSIDGGAYIRYDGTNMPELSGEHTVQVRVAASGSVPAGPSTTVIFTTNVSVPAGGLTVIATDPSGAAHDGKTLITVTPAVADSHRLVYFNFGSGTVVVPNVGDTLSGYLNVPNDRLITAANGDKIGVAEVDAQGRVVYFGQTAAKVVTEPQTPEPSNEAPTGTAGPKEDSVDVLVNGKVENAGKATTTESGGVKMTTVAVDPAKLQAKLKAEGMNAIVTIPVKSSSNVIVGELNGQMVKSMENLSATLVLQTDKGTYTLPAKEINIDELAGKLGSGAKLEDIRFKVEIAQTPDTMAKVVENAASKGEFSVVAPAVDFTVSGTYGGKTVEVTTFNVYVERTVALPDGIDPNRITTGVVVDADGTVRHVPTKVVQIEGKYYAKINSLTNSTYSVVWHPLEFADVANHWAKAAVNDMGSRMVIDGTGGGRFNPDRAITRAEFAAILVRGLGLKLEQGATAFADVKTTDWYGGAINAAYAYELISGYEDGTFRPNDEITREEAMTILSRAMAMTGLKAKLPAQADDAILRSYKDASAISDWARSSVQDNVQAGLASGRGAAVLAPKASITRAEVATLIQRLLQASWLI
ncbi:S-layer homology domain-containing protein [Cohnella sp. GbtcB17]|uniref:S-layer homology domain-containing protein n=1 Tax=Cohnella sp. GbtcB17 TaxID=2824762 RepID=UPI001C305B2D|nr:S-layer homology domain-containing protein [Cohnella sp. GbtcB17]